MSTITEKISAFLASNSISTTIIFVVAIMLISDFLSKKAFKGRLHASALAVLLGLAAAYVAGIFTGGTKGVADIAMFTGVGVMGGSMMRDFAIVSTAFGADLKEIAKCGIAGVKALFMGVIISFVCGAVIALAFGYTDAESVTVIGAGTVTFVVGPVTGTALKVSSQAIAISIAAGVVKSIAVMIITPIVAKRIGLDNPKAAMVYGGLMGTTSGTAAGLAAADPKLVPYGAMTATFFTGLGCLVCPTVLYALVKLVL